MTVKSRMAPANHAALGPAHQAVDHVSPDRPITLVVCVQVDLAAQMADRVIASGASFCLIGDVRTFVSLHPYPDPFNAPCVVSATLMSSHFAIDRFGEASLSVHLVQPVAQGFAAGRRGACNLKALSPFRSTVLAAGAELSRHARVLHGARTHHQAAFAARRLQRDHAGGGLPGRLPGAG